MFKSLIENQVQNAFKILGQVDGLAPNQTYKESADQIYDTATRTYTTGTTDHTDVPMVFTRMDAKEVDGENVLNTDMKVLIAALDLPVIPEPKDKIQDSSGKNYNVERLLSVPGDSLYVLHVRLTE